MKFKRQLVAFLVTATVCVLGSSSAPADPAPAALVEDVPDMTENEIQQVMTWIRTEATGVRLPFCWRQSDPRGVGTIPGRVADCPATYTNNGATCGRSADTIAAPSHLASCPADYTNMGLTCFKGASTYGKGCTTVFHKYSCRSGYTDDGCFCGRGASSLSADSMTCEAGYHKSGIDKRCIKDCPSGYTNTGETCFKGVSTLGMGSMTCKPGEVKKGARCFPANGSCFNGEEEDAGLCYPACQAGFHGVGPICWQNCASGWASCAAGCGTTATECAMTVGNQVLAPLIVAANIATMGLAAPETDAAGKSVDTLMVGGKSLKSDTNLGKALITVVKKLQSIKPATAGEGASITRRIYAARTGTKLKTVMTLAKVTKTAYASQSDYTKAFASDFAHQTSAAINAAIDGHFIPATAQFLKETWGRQQLAEMSKANAWAISEDTLSAVSMVDITGVTGVVQAYAQPICQDIVSFPCTGATINDPSCTVAPPPPVATPAPTFIKNGNNGTVSCATYCGGTMWSGGTGICETATRSDNQQSIGCVGVPGLLPAGKQLTCACISKAPFVKHGNNGTVSCDTYCKGGNWAGGTGVCHSGARSDNQQSVPCGTLPGLLPSGKELTCHCMAP